MALIAKSSTGIGAAVFPRAGETELYRGIINIEKRFELNIRTGTKNGKYQAWAEHMVLDIRTSRNVCFRRKAQWILSPFECLGVRLCFHGMAHGLK